MNIAAVKKFAEKSYSLSPQCRKVLWHLASGNHITNVEANSVYKIRALPRRIADIKETLAANEATLNAAITTTTHRDLTGQRYVRYHLVPRSVS